MRELTNSELEQVAGASGAWTRGAPRRETPGVGSISGYQGAGAILAVLGTGAAIATAPLSFPVIAFGVSAAAGLAYAQFHADFF
jgi:hypothetical protein